MGQTRVMKGYHTAPSSIPRNTIGSRNILQSSYNHAPISFPIVQEPSSRCHRLSSLVSHKVGTGVSLSWVFHVVWMSVLVLNVLLEAPLVFIE